MKQIVLNLFQILQEFNGESKVLRTHVFKFVRDSLDDADMSKRRNVMIVLFATIRSVCLERF